MSAPILVVGNSHLGALKEGLATFAEPPVAVDFFGAPAAHLASLRIEAGRLVAASEELAVLLRRLWGRDALDLAAYEAIAVVGLVSTRQAFTGLYDDFRADAHARVPGKRRVSDATFAKAAAGLLAPAPALALARALAAATEAKVLLVPPPAIRHSVVGAGAPEFIEKAVANGDARALADTYHAALAATPGVAGVVPQPAETLATPLTTRDAFMAGGVRLRPGPAGEQPASQDDSIHANARYGALVLAALADRLGSGGQKHTAPLAAAVRAA